MFVLYLIKLYALFALIQSQAVDGEVDVWPHPQYATASPDFLQIDSTKFVFTDKSVVKCDLLSHAITRTKETAFIQSCSRTGVDGYKPFYQNFRNLQLNANFKGELSGIEIDVKSCEKLPHLEMNEKYNLVVDGSARTARLESDTIWGAIRGLETFSQLVSNVG
ncbi:unnamed protein product, partial [Medioppia subpectinata]